MNKSELVELIRKWWKTWGTLPVMSWVKAAALFRKGKFELAQKYYEKGLEKHSKHPAHFCARLDLAYCLFKLGKLDEAEDQLRFVTVNSPQSREAYLRLARLQLWKGQALEAAWTIKRALRSITPDPEIAAIFLCAVIETDAPAYLRTEAINTATNISDDPAQYPHLEAARAMLAITKGDYEMGRATLARLTSSKEGVPFEVRTMFADLLLREGKVAHARRQLRKALRHTQENPRVLSLLAESYLKSGPFYNAEYARQLATTACRSSGWHSAREMHILAESYYHLGDKASALAIASKAKQAGSRLLGAYRDVKTLERLIQDLSSGTQA